jgi:hypothetical protein
MPDDPAATPNTNPVPSTPSASATPASTDTDGDGELKAMQAIVAALKPLTEEERRRVLEYVLGRFGALPIQGSIPSSSVVSVISGGTAAAESASIVHYAGHGVVHDIRTLKETKGPRSANEMAALVAFYVSELAPEGERKNTISKADIERYFKTAGFNLPADAAFTLVNAKNAGYLDNAGSGQYKLNPVGYNLVAHRMGVRKKSESRRPRVKRAKRAPKANES